LKPNPSLIRHWGLVFSQYIISCICIIIKCIINTFTFVLHPPRLKPSPPHPQNLNRSYYLVCIFAAFVFCALLEFTVVNYMWRKLRPDILRNILTEPVNGGTAGTKPYDENLPSSPVIPVSVVITVQQNSF